MAKAKAPQRSEAEIRTIVHTYFYTRYRNGRGERGKNGVSAKISVIRAELKSSAGLSQSEIARALTYLIDQGWVKKEEEHKTFETPRGTNVPSVVPYYRITAVGVDKIEGKSEFTMSRFHGINIEASGQNIITIGDQNQVDVRFKDIANGLLDLKKSVRDATDLHDSDKITLVADLETIESQLAKREPNKSVIREIWKGIEKLVTGTTLATNAMTLGQQVAQFFP